MRSWRDGGGAGPVEHRRELLSIRGLGPGFRARASQGFEPWTRSARLAHEDRHELQLVELEALAYVGHGVTGFEGQAVALALRPEKILVDKDEPGQPHNKARGVIEDIAYFGSHSVFHVRLPGGTKLLANMINSQRWASEKFTWNDTVWLSWGDGAGVVLTS